MRRKNRETSEEFALSVCDKCECATLSMVDVFGNPYLVVLSIVRKDKWIYFHTAKDGYKIDCLRLKNDVCLSCVGDTYRLPNKFTTEYESAIIRGKAYEVLEEKGQIEALRLLCQKHTATNMSAFEDAIKNSLKRTGVWKIEIEQVSGKRIKYDSDGKELKLGEVK